MALITKSHFSVKLVNYGSFTSFEHSTWEVTIRNKPIHFTAIYHPPYSLRNKSTNQAFLDDFTSFVTNLLPEWPDNVLMGNFNLHVSKYDDIDSAIFLDTLEAMDLYQNVSFPTHKSGNTLDLVISESGNGSTIMTTTPGPFLTNHRAVISTLNIKRVQPNRQTKSVRKLHEITTDQWENEFNPENVKLNANLDSDIESLATEFRRVLDALTPVKDCSVSLKPKKPCFNKELALNKAKVRHHEKKWLKYKLPSTWKAYKKVRNAYYGKLNNSKKSTFRKQISDCSNNSKKFTHW